jgi:hypothetical protein
VYVRVCNKPAHTLAAMGMTGVQNGTRSGLSNSLSM